MYLSNNTYLSKVPRPVRYLYKYQILFLLFDLSIVHNEMFLYSLLATYSEYFYSKQCKCLQLRCYFRLRGIRIPPNSSQWGHYTGLPKRRSRFYSWRQFQMTIWQRITSSQLGFLDRNFH